MGIPCVWCGGDFDLTLLLASYKRLSVWHFVLCCAARNARGATFAASLTSELADSALLGYLRLSLRSTAQGENPFFSAKKKNTEHPNGYSALLV